MTGFPLELSHCFLSSPCKKVCVNIALLAGYLGFGLMWLLSCLTKEPLCAAYVKYNYHGDDALENPIFMKANRILAAGWGILYILIGNLVGISAAWQGIRR